MRSALTMRPASTRGKIQRPSLRWPRALAVVFLVLFALTPTETAAQTPRPDDLRALLYYLDQNDQRAAEAELRRLRLQFPNWTPPTDLAELRALVQSAQTTVDERPIWAKIEQGDYAGARALIEQARTAVPGWTPNPEMIRLLDLNEGQAAFDAAIARRDAAAAIAAARRWPQIMRCDRINNAWQLAEMYRQIGDREAALATYRGTAATCTRRPDAIATLEKANEIATWPQMEELFAVARAAAPTNAEALAALEARLKAGRGIRGGARAQGSATPQSAGPSALAAASATPPQEPVAEVAPPPSTGAFGEQLSALPVRGDSRLAAVRRAKEAGRWAECLAASTAPRSLEVLYERSWCAYNLDRPFEALAGFLAVQQGGAALGREVSRDARFGMILAHLALGMTEEAARLAAATPLTERQRREVEAIILDQRGVRAYQRRDYAQAIAYFNALEQLTGSLRRDLAMLRGYAYLNAREPQRAYQEFARLHAELATEETRAALAAAMAAMGG